MQALREGACDDTPQTIYHCYTYRAGALNEPMDPRKRDVLGYEIVCRCPLTLQATACPRAPTSRDSLRVRMSCSGFPCTASKSAAFPGAMTPRLALQEQPESYRARHDCHSYWKALYSREEFGTTLRVSDHV